MSGLEVDIGPDEWLAFARPQAGFCVFHEPAWAGVMKECYGFPSFIAGVRAADGALAAALPMMETRSLRRRRRWVALPFTDHLQPLASDQAARDRLVEALAETVARGVVAEVDLRWPLGERPGADLGHGFVWHRSDLSRGFAEVSAGFSSSHRRGVRKAEQAGVAVRTSIDPAAVASFYRLHVATRRRQGVPVQPRRFFNVLQRRMIGPGTGFVALAEREGEPLAAAVFLVAGRTIVYKYGASDPRRLDVRPNHALFAAVLEWACGQGLEVMDWGRSDVANDGLRRFKAGWGAAEEALHYTCFGGSVSAGGSGRGRRALGRVISSSPALVCRLSGELLYKYAA